MFKKLLLLFLALVALGTLTYHLYYGFTQETETLDEEARKEIGGNFVKISSGNVYYELQGPDTGQTVILIHGAGSGNYDWDPNYNYLVDNGYRVLRYDLYGRGFSDRVEGNYDTTLFYNQLVEVIDSLHLRGPYHLLAVSMGSSIAIHYAKNNLSSVKSLVLVDPASLGDGTIPAYLNLPVFSPMLMTMYWYPRSVEKQMKNYYNVESVPDYRVQLRKQLKYKGYKRAILSTWQYMLPLNMTKELEVIGNSPIRVLLTWGKYDPLVSTKVSEYYKKAMPQAKYVEIDSAGHLSNYEKPSIFNPAVIKFLRDEE